ncbi:MAG: hypothetical protein D3923_03340 [Candidatus Electrothrix sp. AR3]|nr:hypothetical protein [Candidatus Electrothrix sp. AR3]
MIINLLAQDDAFIMNSYIFILCPPFSGSTVLWRLVGTSDSVSSHPQEGQVLPGVKGIMCLFSWNSSVVTLPDEKLPWPKIKEIWESYWDQTKPLLLEKSPENICRTSEIVEHFNPVYFLLMIRNPYAHCQGLLRRSNLNMDAKKAAEFTVYCMRQQAENAKKLNNIVSFTYEELTEDPGTVSKKIQSLISNIGVLKDKQPFKGNSIKGIKARPLVNLNKQKIELLSVSDLKKINQVLKRHVDIMNYWGYEYYEPFLPRHIIMFYIRRCNVLLFKIRGAVSKRIKSALHMKHD